jgi:hypothetical protein
MGGICSTHSREERCINILVGISEGDRTSRVSVRRRKSNIRVGLSETEW